ncbi:DUF4288 domain-containing protein [Microbulbifer sp. EKSA008]|uniref:DUF4288 domain-containing protein n=1 Tax=unclassified Microbulbifer TaxID=2619833 RepID=UPI0024AD8C90|nr:DUF4288 domain-containing protein [Microbulbifer sp. VAAF005]WHI46077.1 DUF4288 domain-containing protein [Microbulbifer sp. VAAF005]
MSNQRIPDRNKSPYGWWVATIIERFQFDDEELDNMRRRCRAFSNVVILRADDREQAYQKAIQYGKSGIEDKSDWTNDKGRRGRWIFEGLSSLIPIYDELDPEGTEILFDDDNGITVGRVKSWVRSKEELEAFDDTE